MLEVLRIYTDSPLRNFTYIVREPNSQKTLSIDPYDPGQISQVLEKKTWGLDYILNTHEHNDHTCGNDGLVSKYGAKVLAHPAGLGKIPHATYALKEGEKILESPDGNSYLQVIYTPGHTFAHVCLLQIENGSIYAVFTGDTIFNSGVGNCTRGGDPKTLYETVLKEFQNLPGNVRLYPGHDYLKNNLKFSLAIDPSNEAAAKALSKAESLKEDQEFWTTNFSEERTFNPFFLVFDPKENLVSGIRNKTQNQSLVSDPQTLFIALRSLRDKW
ncbi:hydroxyacylglutathione hydrolase [Leptospira hartskeerlii]|uniref:hydroxyacylglutathione hydrolase n=1 Tax=Leptospira hartskeerlii TaxID=2023177 RepID=A0A2M9XES1_9LEPT|nr:hydroxyacylglutathione hydrolase [Leptospira hartskeerlii]PJZ26191.1 hydroxyacylglutathione hydrolase [Leptospira hartskeerlii]PJZ34275.1 hydroxyacylglutathione hydrolase [Leptospira hartskeerlii]